MLLVNAKQEFGAGAFGFTTKALNGANSNVVHRARRQIMNQFGQPGANQEIMKIAAGLVESNPVGVVALQANHAADGPVPTSSTNVPKPDERNEDEYKTDIDNPNEVCISMQSMQQL